SALASAFADLEAGQGSVEGGISVDQVNVAVLATTSRNTSSFYGGGEGFGGFGVGAFAGLNIAASRDVTVDGGLLVLSTVENNEGSHFGTFSVADLNVEAGYLYGSPSDEGGNLTVNGDVDVRATNTNNGGYIFMAGADANASLRAANDVTLNGNVAVINTVENNSNEYYGGGQILGMLAGGGFYEYEEDAPLSIQAGHWN